MPSEVAEASGYLNYNVEMEFESSKMYGVLDESGTKMHGYGYVTSNLIYFLWSF